MCTINCQRTSSLQISEKMALNHWKLLVLLCVFFPLAGAISSNNVFYIGDLQGNPNNSFKTIGEFFANYGADNFTAIVLLDDWTHLDTTLLITNVHNVSISGNGTRVCCHGNDSGLVFRLASNIEISGVSFLNCGSIQESTSTDFRDTSRSATLKLKSALYFHYCTNISITSATFEDNRGVGVVIYDSSGTVAIGDCIFRGNQISPDDSGTFGGGGGVHIEITSCPVGFASTCNTSQNGVDVDNSIYQIRNCNFTENNATTLLVDVSSYITLVPDEKQALGRGGGVYVGMGRSTSNVTVTISGCTFEGNRAVFGGGIFVAIKENATDNKVTVEDCNITVSIATESGGGLYMLYASRSVEMRNNLYVATGIVFRNNSATYHGGMFFMNAFKRAGKNNSLQITRCEWTENRALYGAALGIATRSGISYEKQSIKVDSCSFSKNTIVSHGKTIDGVVHSWYWRAVVSVSFEFVAFEGHTVFEGNVGSALLAKTSTIQFLPFTVANFTNNSGYYGGAIGLLWNSIMLVNNHSKFHFENNTADKFGGAIYLEHDEERNPFSMADTLCPLQFEGNQRINVSFNFVNNTAGISGNSIYFTTLDSCVYLCTRNKSADKTVDNVFKCIGELNYNHSKKSEFSTFNYDFKVTQNISYLTNGTIFAVPGKQFDLPISVVDQFGNPLSSVYPAVDPSAGIYINQASRCVSVSTLRVYGRSNSEGVLKLFNPGIFHFSVELNIFLLPCPPAHRPENISLNNMQSESCMCIRNLPGIHCGNDADNFDVYLIHGYWAGYVVKNGTTQLSPDNFFTCQCPTGFCSSIHVNSTEFNETEYARYYPIPTFSSQEQVKEMDDFVCGSRRRGILCGECRPGFSVFFHSPEYSCHPDKLCFVGWLFYITSELLPLTILFVSVIFFNISFTSGTINGFVLFAQTIDFLLFNKSSSDIVVLTSIYEVFYSFFNLNFFGIDKLSFCLLRGANALDIIALKYATVVFAIVLVAVMIFVMKHCVITRKLPAMFARDSAVTHGLSAFLILCYAQCAQVSFRLLLSSRLYGTSASQHRVLYNGEISPFSLAHLPYAVPALLCLALIVFPPPIILLWHPLGKRLLSLCGLGESIFVRAIDKVLLVNKLMPLIDSFQSCFKDNCRFFAGLHFIYRLSLFGALLTGHATRFYYIWHGAFMLLAHTALQPYRKKLHNALDSLLFMNLLFINLLSLFIDTKPVGYDSFFERDALTASIFRLLLIFGPLICAFGCLVFFFARYFWQKMSNKPSEDADLDISYRVLRSDSEYSLRELKHD